MRISMIGPVTPYRGGIAHFTTMLAKKLGEAGHEVQVISFKKQYPAWLFPGKSDKDHSPGRVQVTAEYLLTALNPLTWSKTIRTIAEFQPQQVIVPWWVTFWAPAFRFIITRLKRKGLPITILIHNTIPHEARSLDRFLARRTLKSADRFIVMTEKEKQRLLALLPEISHVDSAPLPICPSFPKTGVEKSTLKTQLGLPIEKEIILFFGLIRPYKGLDVLLDAFKFLIDQGTQADLLIVGEFWDDKSTYLTHIERLGIEKRIHIHDVYIPDNKVAAFFEVSDVFAAPYVGGTQSAALKTALGFGLPAVATDAINDEMLATLTDRCKIVPARNPEALAAGINEQIQKILQNQEEVEALINRSWEGMLAVVSNQPGQQ